MSTGLSTHAAHISGVQPLRSYQVGIGLVFGQISGYVDVGRAYRIDQRRVAPSSCAPDRPPCARRYPTRSTSSATTASFSSSSGMAPAASDFFIAAMRAAWILAISAVRRALGFRRLVRTVRGQIARHGALLALHQRHAVVDQNLLYFEFVLGQCLLDGVLDVGPPRGTARVMSNSIGT